MKQSLIVCLLLPVFFRLNAQDPDQKINRWSALQPIEKIYLHLDRDEYIAGHTIWLKAYLSSDFLPNDKSTSLFVELLNSSSSLVQRLSLPVVRAVSQGQFELPDTLSEGKYLLRAYTATMLNHSNDFIYKRSIAVTGKEKKIAAAVTQQETVLNFFPEGGNFVAGQPNTIAFKAIDENGWPVDVSGSVKNEQHEVVAEFSSLHGGMGMFDIHPSSGGNYYAVLKNDNAEKRYFLPPVSDKGIVFRLLNIVNGIQFEIFQQKNDPVFQAAYMIGQMQHHSVFKQPLKQGLTELSGTIQTGNLSSGILHITVFNKDGMPLAERLSFVNNKEYIKTATLVADTVNFSARGKNYFSLAFPDSVTGSFSVSVTDPAFHSNPVREENIYSRFLLSSDLKGYVHNPAWYFSSDNDTVRYALDLLMMTHGWRRFRWEQLLKEPLPPATYKDPAFVSLSGQVSLEGTKKPFSERDLLLYIVAADSSRNMKLTKTDKNGYYKVDSLLFFDKARVLFTDTRGKKNLFIDVEPSPDSLNRHYSLPHLNYEDFSVKQRIYTPEQWKKEYESIAKTNGSVLQEITLYSRKKTALEELEEKYTSGSFSSDARKTWDLTNSDDAYAFTNIFDYLQATVPGMQVIRDDYGNIALFYRQMPTISSLGNIGMAVFLDEVPTDPSTLIFIQPSQVAMVKLYSYFVGATGNAPGGALAIYLKKGDDLWSFMPRSGDVITYNGFSVIKEFYSPDYSTPSKSNAPDHRITLHWKPDIFVNGKNIKIPVRFYNNDRSQSFKVVVEGMTTDGRMLMIEQVIAPKAF